MLIVLHRHARAHPRDSDLWPDDRLRALTETGRKVERKVCRGVVRLGIEPDVVLTSPWTRARETAEIFVEELGLDMQPVSTDALCDTPDLAALQEAIGIRTDESTIVLVGHSPWLEELASLLLAGSLSRLETDFPKSGLMGIKVPMLAPGAGRLAFFWRAGQVRRGTRGSKG